eukprot:13079688-Alexandrium_andersonii.AAC.1
MLVKSLQLGSSRCAGSLPMAEAPKGGQLPSTEALQSPLGAASRRAQYYGRERSDRATLGAASRCPTLLCEST